MGLVEYKRNDEALDRARQRDVANENGFGQFAITLKSGRTTIRVMPAWSEKGVWLQEITEHFINGKNRSFPCIAETEGRCPVCEYGASLAAQGQEEAAKSFKASTKFLINALILNDPNGKFSIKDGVKVMKLPATVKKALLDLDTDKSGGYGDIVSFHHGMNVNIDRAGQGLTTKYTAKVVPQRTSIIETIQQEGLNLDSFQLHALDAFVPVKSYDEIAGEFQALMSDAPAAQSTPVSATIKAAPVGVTIASVPMASVPSVTGFAVANAPKVNVIMAPPIFPPKGN